MPAAKTYLILGVAGLGLALAMFFDSNYPSSKTDDEALPSDKRERRSKKTAATEETSKTKLSAVDLAKQLYDQKKLKKKQKQDQKLINEINKDAYTGDGSKASQRLYLAQQAYKRSREATPIIPLESIMKYGDSDTDSLVAALDEMDDQDEQEETTIEAPVIPAVEEEDQREVLASRVISIAPYAMQREPLYNQHITS